MPDYQELLQQLASNPKASPGLLRELSNEDPDLLPVIARNPNCGQELLNNLAISNPKEVLSNPAVHFVSNGYAWFALKSLVSLCMACDPNVHAALLCETKSRIAEGIEELQGQDEASLSCYWLHERTFTLAPKQCNNLISEPIDFEISVKARMRGSGPISVSDLPDLGEACQASIDERREELKVLLSAIYSGAIDKYFDTNFPLEDDGGADRDAKAKILPQGLSFDGDTLYKVHPENEDCDEWEESLLGLEYSYASSEEPVVLREKHYLVVPVVYVDEIDREYDIVMGELGDLAGLRILDSETGLEIDWPSRLAELLLPS